VCPFHLLLEVKVGIVGSSIVAGLYLLFQRSLWTWCKDWKFEVKLGGCEILKSCENSRSQRAEVEGGIPDTRVNLCCHRMPQKG
jgi:hypothetical protein